MITAILIATGRLSQLTESIASFLAQDYADAELLVVNICNRQTLVGEFPRVRFFNIKEQVLPMRAKNGAIGYARGDVVIAWDEMSVYQPGFLTQIEDAIKDREWCWLDHELVMDMNSSMTTAQSSEFSFAFRKSVWSKCGPYPPGINGASDRNLIGRITQMFPGECTAIHDDSINVIRIGTHEERERVSPNIKCGPVRLEPKLGRDYAELVEVSRTGKRKNRLCVVQLGRYGDIISILPLIKRIHDLYEAPHLMVSAKFADILDGISYCKPFVTQLSNEHLGESLAIAKRSFQIVINAGVWGIGHSQKMATKSYCMDAWNNAGFLHLWNDVNLKPEFDRRDATRERAVIAELVDDRSKPIICVNLSDAVSSPCPKCVTIMDEVVRVWGDKATIINLAGYKAHRIYDMLGLFEISSCLVCVDSAFVHLAQATDIGIVVIKNPKPWAGTVVRRNLAAETDYSELDMDKIHEGIGLSLNLHKK